MTDRMALPTQLVPPPMTFEVEPFGGNEGDDVNRFILQCEMHTRPQSHWYSEEEMLMIKCSTVARNLRGNAQKWFDNSLSKVQKTEYAALCVSLKDKFQDIQEPDKVLNAMQGLETLSQGELTIEEYIAQGRKIHQDLPQECRSLVQERMLRNLWDKKLTETLVLFLNCRESEADFETVCRLMVRSGRPYAGVNEKAMAPAPKEEIPSREEEQQLRMFQMLKQVQTEQTDAMINSLVTALQRVKVMPEVRSTYPAGDHLRHSQSDPNPPRASASRDHQDPAKDPCFTCWEKGHFSSDCPRNPAGAPMSLGDERRRYEAYAQAEQNAGRIPRAMPAYMDRRVTRAGEHGPRVVPVAAYVEEDGEEYHSNVTAMIDAEDYTSEDLPPQRRKNDAPNQQSEVDEEQALAVHKVSASARALKAETEAEAFANLGDKRTRVDIESDDETRGQPTTKAVQKTKRPPKAKQGYRHTRMMQETPEFDIVDFVRRKKITVDDNITFGMMLDKSPAWTMELSKSLVRPLRGHRYAERPTENTIRPQTLTAQVADTGRGLPRITNCYTTGKLTVLHKNADEMFTVPRTLLDPGSTMDFINEDVADKLRLRIEKTEVW